MMTGVGDAIFFNGIDTGRLDEKKKGFREKLKGVPEANKGWILSEYIVCMKPSKYKEENRVTFNSLDNLKYLEVKMFKIWKTIR